MTKYKTIQRKIKVLCTECGGLGILAAKHGAKVCSECAGTGEVEKIINEVVHNMEGEDARQNK